MGRREDEGGKRERGRGLKSERAGAHYQKIWPRVACTVYKPVSAARTTRVSGPASVLLSEPDVEELLGLR